MSERTDESTLIRLAAPEDASAIAAVLRRSFAEYESSYTAEAFNTTISTPDRIQERMSEGPIWVAVRTGKIVGTVSVVPYAGALYIRGMAVDPEARGSGIGRELLKRAEEFAALNGLKRLFLSTTPFLSGAIRLYESYGFVRNDEGPQELSGTPLFTMVKILGR